MTFRRFLALLVFSSACLFAASGCGSAPPDAAPQSMTPEQEAEYTRMTLEQQRKAR